MEKNQKSFMGIIKKTMLKENFALRCFIVAFFAILILLIHGLISSIIHQTMWFNINEWIENFFLCTLLLVILISMKKKNHRIVEAVIGELLAIYLVTNTSYFAHNMMTIIEGKHERLNYLYLIIEFILMLSSIVVFFDHLIQHEDVKKENRSKITVRIMIVLVTIATIIYLIATIGTGNSDDLIVVLDEILYFIFGGAVSYAILSLEMRRVASSENKDE